MNVSRSAVWSIERAEHIRERTARRYLDAIAAQAAMRAMAPSELSGFED
jgi:hypothetical protein